MRRESMPADTIELLMLSYIANTMGTDSIALHDRLHQRSIYFALFCLYVLQFASAGFQRCVMNYPTFGIADKKYHK
jgi:hypothetical protein